MELLVVHESCYEYAPPVATAQHLAHLKPANDARQRLLRHELQVDPAPAHRSEGLDAWGNARTYFSLQAQHDRLQVTARSVVQTTAPVEPDAGRPWDEARERMRYHRGAAYDPASEFLFASPYVPRHEDFIRYAMPSFAPGRPLGDAARDLMTRIHRDFEYRTEATDASTPALDALRLRQGVCQDFAHVMLACLRSLGLPARYVSGYLLTEPREGESRLVGSDASHAWVAVYVPGDGDPGGWLELDPTNRRSPGEDYVVLATGRDYSDVSPLRGVLQGGANHRLRVGVTVVPVAAPTIAA